MDELVAAVTDDRSWVEPMREACQRFDIDTTDRQVLFLATCAHESRGFSVLRESMHYSAARLLAVFPRYFTAVESTNFAYQDQRIAERVYGGRMGNGAEGSGDGYAYRGGGLIQLTGRDMYRRCGRSLGVDLERTPELVEAPLYAALSAGWLWAEEKLCNPLADEGKFQAITLRINGGLNGLDDRLAWVDKLRAVT